MTDTKTLGNRICASLRDHGLKPVFVEPVGDAIEIGFELISKSPTWTKSVTVDSAVADPSAFAMLLSEWKAEKRKEIVLGCASSVVRKMIMIHGVRDVMKALEDNL